jgi:Helix-turn-helix.
MDILEKIDMLRRERGWSVYKLAEEAGLTQSTLSNMFARRTLPSVSTLTSICEAFGLKLSQFFNLGEKDAVLTSEENELIDAYRKLSLKTRTAILDFAKKLL